jgi:hypothetical protein
MSPKQIIPALGLSSFSCPHCDAIAAQHWFKVLPKSFDHKKHPPSVVTLLEALSSPQPKDADDKKHWLPSLQRLENNLVTYTTHEYVHSSNWEMVNFTMSLCFSCGAFGLCVMDMLIWPKNSVAVEPHEDMPADVKLDFVEAAAIVDQSPRGAAALARLALQKLMVDLGEKGKNINEDIASLVSKGLRPRSSRR